EWGGAVLMAVEHSPEGRRGFYGSWPQIGVPAGLALATGMVAILASLPGDVFLQWAWRIAFLLSALLVAAGIYIRLKLMETPSLRPRARNAFDRADTLLRIATHTSQTGHPGHGMPLYRRRRVQHLCRIRH